MAQLVEAYVDRMLQLLPQGFAWPTSRDSDFAQLLWPIAEELRILEERNEQLLLEMSPATCEELFDEWEAELGLPGPCITGAQTEDERRNAMVAKYNLVGEQSKQFFIDVAAQLGYTITITEYDAANPGQQEDYQGMPISGDAWNFVWQINVQGIAGDPLYVGSPVGSPLTSWEGSETLECAIGDIAHDHRILFFNYNV